jgi:hypothetical protein
MRKKTLSFICLVLFLFASVKILSAKDTTIECKGTKGTCVWIQHDLFEDVKYPIPGKRKIVTR